MDTGVLSLSGLPLPQSASAARFWLNFSTFRLVAVILFDNSATYFLTISSTDSLEHDGLGVVVVSELSLNGLLINRYKGYPLEFVNFKDIRILTADNSSVMYWRCPIFEVYSIEKITTIKIVMDMNNDENR